MDAGAGARRWLGSGRVDQTAAAVWRLASLASGLALVAPIMLVGRRPYGLGRLTERLRDVQGMAVIPDALPTQLTWFRIAVVACAVGGVIVPAALRRFHSVVVAVALVLAFLVRRGAQQTGLTSPTWQLTAVIAALAVAVVAANVPVRR